VTSVGGTAGLNPEHGTNFSSGGFSYVFPRPVYQDSAVPAFLKTLPGDFAGVFNHTGRGFPDVSSGVAQSERR
jgi:tripeptidyl-peptidase-1